MNLYGFRITEKAGFRIEFDNGYVVSVQFGPGNYCDHYDRSIGRDEEICGAEGSSNAECAVWSKDGSLITYEGWTSPVGSYLTPAQVLDPLNWAATQSEEPSV